uniref:Uncharacterized protein n=1 Tax=Desulfovibrio sp. U5L TaxID=596152 RepID=I2Q3L3_9BACT
MAQGRPKAVRLAGTGEKLYMALKLSGLAWGARRGPNHILESGRWEECGLPRSINTVIEDIRSGMPVTRLDRYAVFFQVPADLFLNEATSPHAPEFSCEILKRKHHSQLPSPPALGLRDALALERRRERNALGRNFGLSRMLAGAYRLFYKNDAAEVLCNGAALVGGQAREGVGVAAVMVFEAVAIELSGIVFQWHNHLHVQYQSLDRQVLGYLMAPDPMQSIVLRQRQPFCLRLYGLAGSLGLSLEPDRFEVVAVRRETSGNREAEEIYGDLCDLIRREPALAPGHPDWAAGRALFGQAGSRPERGAGAAGE